MQTIVLHMGTAEPERPAGRVARRIARGTLPIIVVLLAFAAIGYLTGSPRGSRSTLESMLDGPIQPLSASQVPLQVVVHDLIESVPMGLTIRVCRSLANRPVDVTVRHPEPLRNVLENLATQVGSRLVFTTSRQDNRALPTILCPGEGGDYIVIGQ